MCHFPPGTSKWNKTEHRLFSQITQNWRGRPLSDEQMATVKVYPAAFHGEWDYTIEPPPVPTQQDSSVNVKNVVG